MNSGGCNNCNNCNNCDNNQICNGCILSYGLTDSNGESMTTGFYPNGEYYSEVNGNYSQSRTCYIGNKKCYILSENKTIFIIPFPLLNDLKIRK